MLSKILFRYVYITYLIVSVRYELILFFFKDLTNFYMQYRAIDPYLKRKTPTAIGNKQLFQNVEDRKKLVKITNLKIVLLN